MDILWSMDDLDTVEAFIRSLPMRDALVVNALVHVAAMGGDDVKDLTQARQVIEKIMHLPL
jgi:hypothetical protein